MPSLRRSYSRDLHTCRFYLHMCPERTCRRERRALGGRGARRRRAENVLRVHDDRPHPRAQIRAIWRGGFVGLGEIPFLSTHPAPPPPTPPLSDLIPHRPRMDFHYVYDTGHVWDARPRRGRTRSCVAALLRRFSRRRSSAMHTDVVLLNLLLWTVGESGQPRSRGQALEPHRLSRWVEQEDDKDSHKGSAARAYLRTTAVRFSAA